MPGMSRQIINSHGIARLAIQRISRTGVSMLSDSTGCLLIHYHTRELSDRIVKACAFKKRVLRHKLFTGFHIDLQSGYKCKLLDTVDADEIPPLAKSRFANSDELINGVHSRILY